MVGADVTEVALFPRNLVVVRLRGAGPGILDGIESDILKHRRCHPVISEIVTVSLIPGCQREVVVVVDQSRNRYIGRRLVKVASLSILDRKRVRQRKVGK